MICVKCGNKVSSGDYCCGYSYREGFKPFKRPRKPRPKRMSVKKTSSDYKNYIKATKKRGLLFSLSEEDFYNMRAEKCHYCGQNGGGIDRVDSGIGYIKGNCVPCCKICNWMKLNFSKEFFLNHIRLIAKNNPEIE